MNSREFYHPKLGIFVDKHVGSGIIVDNIFKPMKENVASSVVKKFAKQSGKKALKSGISHVSKIKRYPRSQET